jgi:hypothetical protein
VAPGRRPERVGNGQASPRRRVRARRPQSLLILHLDTAKLRSDGLYLGDVAGFAATIAAIGIGSSVETVDATDMADLLKVLGELGERGRTFDVIVVVAHGNAMGIQIAGGEFADWDVFAKYLRPFKPRRLLLAACQAGRYDAGESLFRANPMLRRIFACPVNASKSFATMMLLAVPWIVAERRPADKHVLWSQVAAMVLTGCQLREWRRATDQGEPDRSLLDFIAVAADPGVRRLSDLVRAALRGK